MPFKKKNQFQLTALSVLLILAIIFYAARIYSVQIINAEEYTDKNDGAASVRTAVLKAPRGEILDCYGRQIAVNRDGYNVVFNKAYVKDNLNGVILTLVNLFEGANVEYKDELPMEKTAPYGFKEGEKTDKLISKLELAHYATAENCFNAMVEKYKLERSSADEQRKIMGVRSGMDSAEFSVSYPYTFAEDIPTELMRKISESGFLLSGVSVEVVPFREYTDTSLAVNLIGTVGPIFAEDWEEYKEKGYSYNDKVGKSGIEKWGEEYLRGTDGEITYRIDTSGNIISSEITKEPVAGKTVMLTLDKKIQRSAQDSIERTVKKLQSEGGTATAGAAVAVHIDSGKVICAANYPTYDSATIGKNYDTLVKDPTKPLTDRAFQGVYPIGSTIKPIVSIAALENGLYHQGEMIKCVHKYVFFADYQPSCMGHHGNISLKNALAKSCNYFFFELGRRLGATKLTDYYKQFYEPNGWHYSLHATLAFDKRSVGTLSLFRKKGKEDFSYKDVFVLEMLQDHLALRLNQDRNEHADTDTKHTVHECVELYGLTRREEMILRCLVDGLEADVICQNACITNNTLKKHILNIYKKLGIKNRVQMFKLVKEKEN